MEKASELEKTVKEGGFLKRKARNAWGFTRCHIKKIGLALGSIVLTGAMGASYIAFKKEGKPITGQLDGKVDNAYYSCSRK